MKFTKETLERVTAYREKTFHSKSDLRLRTIEDAVRFVNERGFVFFWPIKGIEFPSLWSAVTGKDVVANDHDDPGHVTWRWKDTMLGKKQWYYGRVLRKKNTIISLDSFPYFYALSPNYGEYELDYLSQYQQGLMTAESKAIYEALLFDGPLDTISLRNAARMSSKSSASRFQRALDQLQVEMKILPTGVSEAGAWRYAFIYDIVPRHFPTIEKDAGVITENDARSHLISKSLLSLGMIDFVLVKKLFHWNEKEIFKTIDSLPSVGNQGFKVIEEEGKYGIILKQLL